MKVSRRWIEWAHGPGAEDGQSLAMRLCELASAPGVGAISVSDPALIAELVDALEAQAKAAGLGLWADSHPIAPWEWQASRRE